MRHHEEKFEQILNNVACERGFITNSIRTQKQSVRTYD